MPKTLTIRLDPADREILEVEARARGIGLSTFVRKAAEAEADRLRKSAIRAAGQRVMSHVNEIAEARAELEEFGTPQLDIS